MRSEVPRQWVVDIAKYLELDEDTVKAVLIDMYGVYVQSYVLDDNGLTLWNKQETGPLIRMDSIPVVD